MSGASVPIACLLVYVSAMCTKSVVSGSFFSDCFLVYFSAVCTDGLFSGLLVR